MSKAVKIQKRIRRHRRVRVKIRGIAKRPRLCVFRSNQHIYAQLINDEIGKTLAAASDLEIKIDARRRHPGRSRTKRDETKDLGDKVLTAKVAVAFEVGRLIAQKALKKKIKQVIFDRGGYRYHGRVKALAQGAREEGLKF